MFDKLLRLAAIIGTLPVTLTNGTVADATQVMSDLNWVVNQVNANAAPLSNTALLNATNNFTAVQSGVAATAQANFPIASQVQNNVFNTLSSTLGTNTLTARIAALALTAYPTGGVFTFTPNQTNTGAMTVNVDGVGAVNVFSGGSALVAGQIRQAVPLALEYDGTRMNALGGGRRYVFTPTVSFGGGSNVTYSNQAGRGWRADGMFNFSLNVNLSARSSAGTFLIGGLPEVSAAGFAVAVSARLFGSLGSTTQSVQGYVQDGTNSILLEKVFAGVTTTLTDSDIGAPSQISISGTYPVTS